MHMILTKNRRVKNSEWIIREHFLKHTLTHVPHSLFAPRKANACFLCMTLEVKTKYLKAIIMVP